MDSIITYFFKTGETDIISTETCDLRVDIGYPPRFNSLDSRHVVTLKTCSLRPISSQVSTQDDTPGSDLAEEGQQGQTGLQEDASQQGAAGVQVHSCQQETVGQQGQAGQQGAAGLECQADQRGQAGQQGAAGQQGFSGQGSANRSRSNCPKGKKQ